MEIPPELAAMAKPVGEQLPNVFLGEFQHFNWGFETCVLDTGFPGIRFIFYPALLPMFKFSLPFHAKGLEALRDDINTALENFAKTQADTPI